MKLLRKKHYCLSACLLFACNQAKTSPADTHVSEALELARLLPQPKISKADATLEALRKKVEEGFHAGEKMIQEAEKKARQDFNTLFDETKPNQNPKTTTPSEPKPEKSLQLTALKEKYLDIKKELSEQAEKTNKLNLRKVFISKADLDDDELDEARKQIQEEEKEIKEIKDRLNADLKKVTEDLKANNMSSLDLLYTEKDIQEYQSLSQEKKEALENGNIASFNQNVRLNDLQQLLKNKLEYLLHKQNLDSFAKEILEDLKKLFPQSSAHPKQTAKPKDSNSNSDSDSEEQEPTPKPKAKMPKKLTTEEDDW